MEDLDQEGGLSLFEWLAWLSKKAKAKGVVGDSWQKETLLQLREGIPEVPAVLNLTLTLTLTLITLITLIGGPRGDG